jgi:hypothetical protein
MDEQSKLEQRRKHREIRLNNDRIFADQQIKQWSKEKGGLFEGITIIEIRKYLLE